jgi:DNA primase
MEINSIISEINSRIDIVDFISRFVELKKAGRNYVGLCPFHYEKTPSFTVSREKGIFYCFGCKTGGNIIEFVKRYENLTFPEAVNYLSEVAGLPKPEWKGLKQDDSEKNKLYEINSLIAKFFNESLYKNHKALDYLYKRGLSKEIIQEFVVGYAEEEKDAILRFIREKGLSETSLQELGLISSKDGTYYPYFRDRIIFPIENVQSKVIGFGGRAIREGIEPKYLNSPDNIIFHKGENLFGLNLAKTEVGKKRELIVVEGYMDVIALFMHSIRNAVATLGTSCTQNHIMLLKKYMERLYLCFDNDSAGRIATKRALEIIIPMEINCKVIEIPSPYKDPDEFLKACGSQEFIKLKENAKDSFPYLWEEVKKEYDFKDPLQVSQAISEILSKLVNLSNDILLESYFKFLSSDTSISAKKIEAEFLKLRDRKEKMKPPSKRFLLLPKERENFILKGLIKLEDDTIIQEIFEKVKEEDFGSEDKRRLFIKLNEIFKKFGYLKYEEIINNNICEDDLKQLILELSMIDDSFVSREGILEYLSRIETERKLNYLQESLRKSIKEGNNELSKYLEEELSKIVKEKNE